jgi:ribonuclease M5
MDKLKLRQAIVVEGKYDQNTLRQLVDTAIFTTNGFTGMKDPALLRLLQQAAQTTGLVILTDSDGAGFLIRNTLKSALPETGVLHAYIPDLPGKEKRKAAPGKEGLLGVEGMTPEILLKALRDAGAEFADGSTPPPAREPITKQDLFALGLSGGPESAKKRAALLKALSLPAHMSANALLQALNVLFSREEFFTQARRLLEP